MTFPLNCFLILAGLTGVCYCRITTIKEVQVMPGASISIPCLYDSKYKNHVKYLCKGYYWHSCSYAVKTNKPDTFGKFLIKDVKEQKTFTVTINSVGSTDSDYWCVVEVNGGADHREHFQLSVSSTPALSVDRQKMEGFRGGNITINCHSRSSEMRKWCKLGGNCVTRSSEFVDGTRVIINKNHSIYSVTMIGLKQENSGWYWCVRGQFQIPVYLTVTERPATTLKSVTFTTTVANATQPSVKERTDPTILFISLGLLIFIVLVVFFVWFVLKGKQAKTEPPMEKTEDKVVYSDVTFQKRKTTEIAPESDVNVLYSSVVSFKEQDRRVKKN